MAFGASLQKDAAAKKSAYENPAPELHRDLTILKIGEQCFGGSFDAAEKCFLGNPVRFRRMVTVTNLKDEATALQTREAFDKANDEKSLIEASKPTA